MIRHDIVELPNLYFFELPNEEEKILAGQDIVKKEIWQSTNKIIEVMTSQHKLQEENTLSMYKEIIEIKQQNCELYNQILFYNSIKIEIIILIMALISFGFFIAGYFLTIAKNLSSFGIVGTLGIIIPGFLSLISQKKQSKNGVKFEGNS